MCVGRLSEKPSVSLILNCDPEVIHYHCKINSLAHNSQQKHRSKNKWTWSTPINSFGQPQEFGNTAIPVVPDLGLKICTTTPTKNRKISDPKCWVLVSDSLVCAWLIPASTPLGLAPRGCISSPPPWTHRESQEQICPHSDAPIINSHALGSVPAPT